MSLMIGYSYGQQPNFTASDIDQLNESESARLWEEHTAPAENEEKYLATARQLRKAVDAFEKAVIELEQAFGEATGLPVADKIDFFIRDFEDRIFDLEGIAKAAEEGKEL